MQGRTNDVRKRLREEKKKQVRMRACARETDARKRYTNLKKNLAR